jgi:RNA polymerase sigma factor (sigma-70 family)
LHDADDALQETLLRAWRGIARFEPRSPIAAWLYRIATKVSLRMIEQRQRRDVVPIDAHLEPYPQPLVATDSEPATSAESREAIGLAFVAAMQLLPPRQRAILVLRDVLDWSAREVAELFDDSVAAVNSALQRARERLRREREEGSLVRLHAPAAPAAEARVMRRFQPRVGPRVGPCRTAAIREGGSDRPAGIPGTWTTSGRYVRPTVVHVLAGDKRAARTQPSIA